MSLANILFFPSLAFVFIFACFSQQNPIKFFAVRKIAFLNLRSCLKMCWKESARSSPFDGFLQNPMWNDWAQNPRQSTLNFFKMMLIENSIFTFYYLYADNNNFLVAFFLILFSTARNIFHINKNSIIYFYCFRF